jgi:hypothetical protein
MKNKKASKGDKKAKTLKPGKSIEKKQPLTSFNYGSIEISYKPQ